MEIFKTCSLHKAKRAKRYCQQCNENICNECALTNHSSHINSIEKISDLPKINYSFLTEILLSQNGEKFPKSLSNVFCINNNYHQANNYCSTCSNFYCNSCLNPTHKNHSVINLGNLFDSLGANIEILLHIYDKDNMWNGFDVNSDLEEIDTIITEICNIRQKIGELVEERNKNYYQLIETFNQKVNKISSSLSNSNLPNIDNLKSLFNQIKLEKNNSKLINLYIEYLSNIQSILKNEDDKKELVNLFSKIKKNKEILKEKNKTIKNEFLKAFSKNLIEGQHSTIKINKQQYENEISNIKTQITNIKPQTSFTKKNNINSNVQTSIGEPNPFKEMSKKHTYTKSYVPERKPSYQHSGSIHIQEIKKMTSETTSEDNSQDGVVRKSIKTFDEAKKIFDNGLAPNLNNILPLASMTNIIQKSHNYSKSYLPQNNTESQEKKQEQLPRNDSNQGNQQNFQTKGSLIDRIKEIYEPKDAPKEETRKKSFIKKTTEKQPENVNKEDKKLSTPKFDREEEDIPKEEFFTDNSQSQIHNQSEGGNDSLDGRDLIDGMNEGFKQQEKNNFISENQENNIVLASVIENSDTIYIFSTENQKIQEVKLPSNFSTNFACTNVYPSLYISGGIKGEETSNEFIQISLFDDLFDITVLPSLTIPKSHHTMVYHKKDNSIYILTGSKANSCEKFSFETQSFTQLPSITNSRENALSLIHNDTYLYVFFGYDKSIGKYCQTIERLNIENGNVFADKWEVLQPSGNSNFTKRKEIGYIQKESSVILLGGSNSLKDSTNNVMEYDYEKNEIVVYNGLSLPVTCAFTNSNFLQKENVFYNISKTNQVIGFTFGNEETINLIC